MTLSPKLLNALLHWIPILSNALEDEEMDSLMATIVAGIGGSLAKPALARAAFDLPHILKNGLGDDQYNALRNDVAAAVREQD